MKLSYLGTVTDGKLIMSNRKAFDNDLAQFEGKRVEIELSQAKKHRSNNQNAYLWGVVYPVAMRGLQDLGNEGLSPDLIHTFFKDKFLDRWKDIVIPTTGEVFKVKTTTDLTTTEMMGYIESISRWSAEFLNVIIPEPYETN